MIAPFVVLYMKRRCNLTLEALETRKFNYIEYLLNLVYFGSLVEMFLLKLVRANIRATTTALANWYSHANELMQGGVSWSVSSVHVIYWAVQQNLGKKNIKVCWY